jgi:hypothetical protein
MATISIKDGAFFHQDMILQRVRGVSPTPSVIRTVKNCWPNGGSLSISVPAIGKCRVDFDSVSWLDHLIAVSCLLPERVGCRQSQNGQVRKFGAEIAPS